MNKFILKFDNTFSRKVSNALLCSPLKNKNYSENVLKIRVAILIKL